MQKNVLKLFLFGSRFVMTLSKHLCCGVGWEGYCQNKIVDPDLQGIYDF
jgi:hypothetical protein